MQDLEKQVFTGRICDVRYFFTFTGSICVDLQEEEVKEHFTTSKHCSTVIYNPRKSTKRSIDILLEVLASCCDPELGARIPRIRISKNA